MSITSPDDRISTYFPVVATTEFAAQFPIFDNDDIAVYHNGVEREDFAVSATYIEGVSVNAKAVFAVGITGRVDVIGARAPRRSNEFNNGGPLPTRDQNLALNTLEAEVQEQAREAVRAVKVAFGADSQDLPPPETGKVLGWDSLGKLINQMIMSVGNVVFGAIGLDVAASGSKQAAQTAIGFPTMEATKYPRVKADGTGYEMRSPAQVAGDLNVPQRNSDGGLNFSTTQTSQDWNGYYGGAWKTSNRNYSTDTATFGGSRSTATFFRQVTGSGTNGPAFTDAALFLESAKFNPYTTTVDGEIDIVVATGRNGLHGDLGGFLVDLEKVGGGTGGAVGIETAVKKVDNTGAIVQRVQAIQNMIEGAGSVSGGTGYGYWTEAQVGNPFSALHADQSQAATGAAFQNFVTFTKDRTAASMIFKIDGNGRTYGANGGGALPAYSFISDPNTGMSRVGEDQLGFVAGGAFRFYVDTGAFVPATDNAYSLGRASTGRVSNIYTVNAPTVGSDERLKADIIDSPLGLDFILSLRPVAYKLKEGGIEIEWRDEEIEVEEPLTIEGEVVRQERYFDGSKTVTINHVEKGQVPIYDTVHATDPKTGELLFRDENIPEISDDGLPIVTIVESPPIQARDEDGNLLEIPQPPQIVPKTKVVRKPVMHAIPRTERVKKTIKVPVEVKRAGRRQHFGLIAQEVKGALPEGIDFGGWVKEDPNDPNSLESLRYEQFIPSLIAACQTLYKAHEELADQLATLKQLPG